MDLPQKEAAALASQEKKHRKDVAALDAEERKKNRHARRALHAALVSVRQVHLQLLSQKDETIDASDLVEQLANAIVEAEVIENSGSLEEVEALTKTLNEFLK